MSKRIKSTKDPLDMQSLRDAGYAWEFYEKSATGYWVHPDTGHQVTTEDLLTGNWEIPA